MSNEQYLTVVMAEPGKEARITEIKSDLESMQKAVGGGYIEAIYPFSDGACIICNDEGKFNGMKANRTLYGEQKQIVDVIYGPFFVCEAGETDFKSLSPEKQKKYLEVFRVPEKIMLLGGRATMVPCPPDKNKEMER